MKLTGTNGFRFAHVINNRELYLADGIAASPQPAPIPPFNPTVFGGHSWPNMASVSHITTAPNRCIVLARPKYRHPQFTSRSNGETNEHRGHTRFLNELDTVRLEKLLGLEKRSGTRGVSFSMRVIVQRWLEPYEPGL